MQIHPFGPATHPSLLEMIQRGFRVISVVCLTLLSACLSLASHGQSLKTKSGFGIYESGYWTCEAGRGRCVYWLDNDRIIFNGSKPNEIDITSDGRRIWKHAIYIWHLKTGEVTKYADASRAALCHVDGYLWYTRNEGNDLVVLGGPLGKEVEIGRRTKEQQTKVDPEGHGWRTELSCHRYRPKLSSALVGVKVALKEGNGFLYFGPGTSPAERREPVLYFPPSSATEVKLPVARWQVSPPRVMRNDFDDSYLLAGPYRKSEFSGVNLCPGEPVQRFVYRLNSSGDLTTIVIPADRKVRCYVSVVGLSRIGVLLDMGAGHATNVDLSVLYALEGHKLNEVIRGVTMDHAVSPDGCMLALGNSATADIRRPTTAATYRGHLKVVELCK